MDRILRKEHRTYGCKQQEHNKRYTNDTSVL
jgi:hypothetical protein